MAISVRGESNADAAAPGSTMLGVAGAGGEAGAT